MDVTLIIIFIMSLVIRDPLFLVIYFVIWIVFTDTFFKNCFSFIVKVSRKIHDPKFRRLAFNFNIKDSGYKPNPNHTHPNAAKLRNDTVCSIRNILRESNYKMYDPSPAQSFRDEGVKGHRHAYSIKDLSSPLPYESDYHGNDIVYTLIDQDYYYESLESFGGKPIVISTLSVDQLSGKCPDSSWYFVGPNIVVEQVTGGATYLQSLYNYTSDQVVLTHTYLMVIPVFTVYDVHIYKIDNTNKMVVFLCPSTTHYMSIGLFRRLSKWFMGKEMQLPLLTRMDHIKFHGSFLIMKCKVDGAVGYSLKRNSDQAHDSSVFIPEATFKSLEYMSRNSKSVSAAEIERITKAYKTPISGTALATVVEFFGIPYTDNTCLNVFLPPSTSHGDCVYDIGKPKAELIIPPITDETAVVISENEASRRSYVEERMIPNINKEVFSDEMIAFSREYVCKLIKTPGRCVPSTLQDVVADQRGRLQIARNKLEMKFETDTSKKVKVAMKAETALKGGAARGVTTVSTSHSLDTGALSRGIKPALKLSSHYVVGLTPQRIAEKVTSLSALCASKGREVGETDYSKLDESISHDIRKHLIEPTFLRAFGRDYHDFVNDTLSRDKDCTGNVGAIKINTGGKNNSGTGITTDTNTITCPFIVYVAHRKRGMSKDEAYACLGVAFGDDGLSVGGVPGDGFGDLCIDIAKSIGLTLKYISHAPAAPLYFLGRQYVSPLDSYASMALPSKVLLKLPVCIGKSEEHRADRLRGYYVTERHVPVVSDYIRAAARAYKIDLNKEPENLEMLRLKDRDLYYKITHGPYPCEVADEQALLTAVCADLSLSEVEVEKLVTQLRAVTTIKDFEHIRVALPPISGLERFQRQ